MQKQLLAELEQQLNLGEQSLSEKQQVLQEAKSNHKEIELKLASLSENLSVYDQDKQQYDRDLAELENRDQELRSELTTIEDSLQSFRAQIDGLSKQELEWKENQDQIQQDYHHYQVLLAEQEERVKNQQEKTNILKERLTEQTERFTKIAEELEELISISQSNETEEEINGKLIEKSKEKEAITSSIQEMRSDRMARTQRMQDEERELKEESKKHHGILQQIQQKEVKANRIDVELENRLSLLQTEYMMTYERAKKEFEKVENVEEAKHNVSEIKARLERLGNVNIGAIDEYDRISERYTFLTDQRNDLVEAKQTLFAVIKEMDEEMEHLFSTTFGQIKDEFAIVFKELFGGGHAELKLTDPKNLLDTGVDIIAQPPGKKLQNLGLLSGGERR